VSLVSASPSAADRLRVRTLSSGDLTPPEVSAIRGVLDAAFWVDPDERFTDDDWDHALGGLHLVADVDGVIVGHAAVVPRTLYIRDRPVRTGYVEAVATAPDQQGRGIGTQLLTLAGEHISEAYELGALGTGSHGFYERFGWRTWSGPSSVRTQQGERRTPDDDGYIMVLETPSSPPLDLAAPIGCEWRGGDVW
jgi:aminoglycoside 2'-N-acetyltransferase I